MVTRAAVVAEARTWRDVPVRHMGRNREAGVDCLGLALLVGIGSGALVASIDEPDYYGRLPNPRRLVEGLARYMLPIALDQVGDGDVLALSWGLAGAPMHLAIRATWRERPTIIHGLALVRPPRVVEMGYAAEWPDRACSAWRYPRLEP